MGIIGLSAVLVVLPILTVVHADPPSPRKADEPPGLLEVPVIGIVEVNGKWSFNNGRRYSISVNKHLPDAMASRAALVATLHEQKQLDQVVFDWFGKKLPTRLNLLIGDNVPVEMAQAVVAAYADGSKIPVHITLMTEDEQLGLTRAVYVGGLVDRDDAPVMRKQIQELLKPGLTHQQFAKVLLKQKD